MKKKKILKKDRRKICPNPPKDKRRRKRTLAFPSFQKQSPSKIFSLFIIMSGYCTLLLFATVSATVSPYYCTFSTVCYSTTVSLCTICYRNPFAYKNPGSLILRTDFTLQTSEDSETYTLESFNPLSLLSKPFLNRSFEDTLLISIQ